MTAFFRPALAFVAIVSMSTLMSLSLPAVALDAPKPSLRTSSDVVAVKDVRTKRSHYRKRYRGETIYAPFTRVDRGRRHTTVDAPFAHVHNGRRGKRVVAPFVDLWIPN